MIGFYNLVENVYSAVRTGSINKAVCACATYIINWLVFITVVEGVYSGVRTVPLNKATCAPSFKGWDIRSTVAKQFSTGLDRFQACEPRKRGRKKRVANECSTPSHHGPFRPEMGSAWIDDQKDEACSVTPFTDTTVPSWVVTSPLCDPILV
jgi:hypothetical protein